MRRALAATYAFYLVCVGYLVFSPVPDTPGGAVEAVHDLFDGLGLAVARPPIEFSLNIVMFVPLSLLGWFLFDRRTVGFWLAAGLALSAVIETVQGVFLPDRVAAVSDLVANTAGAGLGCLVAMTVSRVR